jgi:hypothetical protein
MFQIRYLLNKWGKWRFCRWRSRSPPPPEEAISYGADTAVLTQDATLADFYVAPQVALLTKVVPALTVALKEKLG